MVQVEPDTLINQTVYDNAHQKVGKITQLYVDEKSNTLTWAAVDAGGLFGSKEAMLPLAAAHIEQDGLVTDLPKDAIKKAPQVDAKEELTNADQETLFNFYNEIFKAQSMKAGKPTSNSANGTDKGTEASRPSTDSAMTRSEERLHVDKRQKEARMRLKKYIVTEHQTVTVPLKKEKLHIEREPITETNRYAAMEGLRLSTEEHDIVLREEVPHISKETKPVERVRISKDTTQRTHREERKVRKEQIGVERIDADKPEK